MKQPAFIGIDPGIRGAAVLLSDSNLEIFDFESIGGASHQVNIWRVEYEIKGVVLENPPLRGRGGKNLLNSKFIINLGQWEGVLVAYYLDYILVAPVTWQKKYKNMGYGSWQSKHRTIETAQLLFPFISNKICLVKHEHRADAVLIALYCKDLFGHGGNQMQLPQVGKRQKIKA